MNEYKIIEIYTDGSAAPNPGPGGFGVVAIESTYFNNSINKKEVIYSHKCRAEEPTTNNREELKAIIDALNYVDKHVTKRFAYEDIYAIHIYCDSSYVVNICNEWINGWHDNEWRNSKNVPVQNVDLLIKLYGSLYNYRNQFHTYREEERPWAYTIAKVNGHNSVAGNEYADALATNNTKKLDEWYDKMLEI